MHKRALCGTTLIAACAQKGGGRSLVHCIGCARPHLLRRPHCGGWRNKTPPLLRRSGSGGCSGRSSSRCRTRCLAPNRQLSGSLCRGLLVPILAFMLIVHHYSKDAGACQMFSFGRSALSPAGPGGRRRKKSRIKGSEVTKVKRSARGWVICTPAMPRKAGSSPISGIK